MTDDTLTPEPGEETLAPDVNTLQQPQEAPPAGAGASGEGAEQPKPEEPKRRAWWQDRIDELTRDKYVLKEERDRALKERETLAALMGKPKEGEVAPPSPEQRQPPKALSDVDLERLVDERASAKAALERHNQRASEVWNAGVAEHGEKFQQAMQTLAQAGIELGASPFVQAALETEAPEKVMFALGSDPEKAMQLAQMSPTKMAIEMDRLARELVAPPARQVSKAPPPSPELRGGNVRPGVNLADSKTDLHEWMAERERQLAARRSSGQRVQ